MGHAHIVTTLIELKNGSLASGSWDNTIKLWRRDGSCLATLKDPTFHVNTLIELKDGTLANGSSERITMDLWSPSGSYLTTLKGHTHHCEVLIELKDGTLASGSKDKTIKLWTFPLMN
jgi:WD40 repeat protein